MNFEARTYLRKNHYELIEAWFKARNFPAPDPELLPPVGCVVYSDSKPVCAGFLFETNTPCAVIAHLIADKSVDKGERSNALNFLIINLQWAARERGFKTVMCSSNIKPAKDRFEALGFEKGDENVTTYRRDLCHSGD